MSQSSPREQARVRDQLQENQWERNQHSNNLNNGQGASFEQKKAEFLEKLTQTGMSDAATRTLDNMIDQTFVLGYLSDAKVQEIEWRLHTMYLKIKSIFPPENSALQGKFRAFVYDDRDEDITSLTEKQKLIISQMIIGISVLVSRSKQGFQQEQMVKSINVSEVQNPSQNDGDGFMQRFLG